MSSAVVFHGIGDLRLEEMPVIHLGDDDVRLRVEACGVCGSDITSYFKGLYVQPGQVMGHEVVGSIVETGRSAGTRWSVGQRVMVRPLNTCGQCRYCRSAEQQLCGHSAELSLAYGRPGAYAQEMVVFGALREQSLIEVRPEVRTEDAVWTEPLAVSLHALNRASLAIGESLGVIGAGSVGLSLTAAARAAGSQVHVVEPREMRRSLAGKAGANSTSSPGETDRRFDVVFDTSGTESGATEGLRLLQPGGRLVLIGVSDQNVPVREGTVILGAFGYRSEEFARSASLINRGEVSLGDLITHQFGLSEVDLAIATTRDSQDAGKVIIVPDGMDSHLVRRNQ